MNKDLTDTEVLHYLSSNDQLQTGIEYLYKKHFEDLSRYILYNKGSWEDAQDIFQETMISFISMVQQNKFRGESSIKTILFSINKNLWFNELKKRSRSNLREVKYEQAYQQEDKAIGEIIEQREASQLLIKIVDQLGENCKKILLLFYYEKLSMKEIVTNLEYENEQVIRNKKYKCLKKLEELIGAEKNLFEQLKTLLHG